MYKCHMKNALYLATLAILLLGKHYFLPSFSNVIKNKITSSETHIIVCIVLRRLCYVGKHVSVQCFDTPASATTLLLRGQARLCSVLRHSY